jgi:hypothetical protein
MSYEGYNQLICVNGHYTTADCYHQHEICFICAGKIVFNNAVDETNCEAIGVIPDQYLEKLKLTDSVCCTCESCRHRHVKEIAIYRCPTDEELKKFRHYFAGPDIGFKPLKE